MSRSRLGRLAARLTGGTLLERLAALDEKIGKLARAHRDDLAVQRELLDRLRADVANRATGESIRALSERVEDLHSEVARQDRTLADALERARVFDEQAVDDRRFARRMEALARTSRPIIVGPWTGEVGFELLYWVPFVRWAVKRYGIDPARLLVVSRGGPSRWYGPLSTRYADVFSFFSPEAFRAATEDAKKQRRVGEFDARVLDRVREAYELERAELLHPGMMYRLFMPFWRELATMTRVEAYTEYEQLSAAEPQWTSDLPREYIAARFYFSDCFPDTPDNRAFVAATLETLSRQMPVVLLNTPFAVDDHRDAAAFRDGRMVTIAERMTAAQNLAVQSAVIATARAFVGTYGGYSYLAPFCGVPGIAFYSTPTFKAHHLHLAQRVFDRLGGASLVPLDVRDVPLVRQALAGVEGLRSQELGVRS